MYLTLNYSRCVDDSKCLEDEWQCGNQLCIPQSKRCDGHFNCYDHTDEHDCGKHIKLLTSLVNCNRNFEVLTNSLQCVDQCTWRKVGRSMINVMM